MRTEELAMLRVELNRRRHRVIEAASRADAELTDLEQSTASAEAEEGARVRSDADALVSLGDAERREVARIDAALARMDGGSYGTCADCGEEIGLRRLTALPHALRCQGCEEAREQAAVR